MGLLLEKKKMGLKTYKISCYTDFIICWLKQRGSKSQVKSLSLLHNYQNCCL